MQSKGGKMGSNQQQPPKGKEILIMQGGSRNAMNSAAQSQQSSYLKQNINLQNKKGPGALMGNGPTSSKNTTQPQLKFK